MQSKTNLLEIVHALSTTSSFTSRLYGRKQLVVLSA